jgi:hypothetical protein
MRSLLNLKHTLNDEYVDVPSRSLDSSGYAIDHSPRVRSYILLGHHDLPS